MKLEAGDGVPIYLQIIDLVKRQILSGRYVAGEKLPSVRELALELRVNPNTVARAYRQLQDDGVIDSRPGGGNYAADSAAGSHNLSRELAREELAAAVDRARKLNVSDEEIKTMIEEIIRKGASGHA